MWRGIKPVIEGIAAAKEAGLGVKVNMVVKKETNQSQMLPNFTLEPEGRLLFG